MTAEMLQTKGHIFKDAKVGKQGVILKDNTHITALGWDAGTLATHGLICQFDPTDFRGLKPCNCSQ